MANSKPSIGIIGAGRLGTALAQQALKAGYEVRIANSKGPESLKLIQSVLFPGAIVGLAVDAITLSDIVILALPFSKFTSLPPELFAGKIIIDAMNYWEPTEGHLPEFAAASTSSSEYVQNYFSQTIVVKSLNHVAYNELADHALPAGDLQRRAIVLSGNDAVAKRQVAQFIDDLGFDAVDLGELKVGAQAQPDTKLFNARFTAAELKQLL